jgi:hypothetical protein
MRNTKGKEAKRSYSRHGLTPLRQKVKIRGIDAIDKRTAAGKALVAWRREPIDHLGGNPMAAQIALIDLACRSKLLLEHLDACLLEQGSLVNKRSREVLPWERLRFAEGLTPGRDSAKTTSMSALFLLAALLFM